MRVYGFGRSIVECPSHKSTNNQNKKNTMVEDLSVRRSARTRCCSATGSALAVAVPSVQFFCSFCVNLVKKCQYNNRIWSRSKMRICILVENERYYQIFVFENLRMRLGIQTSWHWDIGLDFRKFLWRYWDFRKFSVVTLVFSPACFLCERQCWDSSYMLRGEFPLSSIFQDRWW